MLEISGVGIFTAVLAGAISFLSPCVLPLVPGYLSYVAGESLSTSLSGRQRARAFGLSAMFVLGFSTVFVALGASATVLSRLLLSYRYEANIVGGIIIIIFGIFMTGLVRMPWMQRDLRLQVEASRGRAAGAYVLGLAFAFGWTPCIGPILGAILTLGTVSATAGGGLALLSFYSLGLAIPFLLAALFTEALFARMRNLRKTGRILHLGAGLIMVAMGTAMITGHMTTFSFWLLETFPILSTIG